MNSVLDLVGDFKQPRGGLLPLSKFTCTEFGGNSKTHVVPSILTGKVIDCITKRTAGLSSEEVFKKSIDGYAMRIDMYANKDAMYAKASVDDISTDMINDDTKNGVNVYLLVHYFDLAYESGNIDDMVQLAYMIIQYEIFAEKYKTMINRTIGDTRPVRLTEQQILELTELYYRTLTWLITRSNYGIVPEFKFYPDGYSDLVKFGSGDFICGHTMFELKCSVSKPTPEHVLQLLIYYCMSLHTHNKLYSQIYELGIYNPMLNKEWIIPINRIPDDVTNTLMERLYTR